MARRTDKKRDRSFIEGSEEAIELACKKLKGAVATSIAERSGRASQVAAGSSSSEVDICLNIAAKRLTFPEFDFHLLRSA